MKSSKEKILKLLSKNSLSVKEISKQTDLSRQIIHRHLKDLLSKSLIEKNGKPPRVFYFTTSLKKESLIKKSIGVFKKDLWGEYKKISTKALKKQSNAVNNAKFDFLLEESAVFSSKIEGNTLDLNSFLNSKNFGVGAKKKEVKEISDLIKAYEFAQKNTLNEKNLLKVHGIISRTLLSKNRQGKYRNEPVGIFSEIGLVYLAIEPIFIQHEMTIFFTELQKIKNNKLSKKEVFFWASWVHLLFVLIHPFADGNGRVARLLEKWFLAEVLEKEAWGLQTEKFYFQNRKEYYRNLSVGVNYWESDFKKAKSFLKMLPRATSQ